MPQHSEAYRAVLASDRWRWVRAEAVRRAGYRCERCGAPGRLDGHHWRGYRMLGHEAPEDVVMLCRACHNRAHGRASLRLLVGLVLVVALVALLMTVLHPA
jgi:hypothetical protein